MNLLFIGKSLKKVTTNAKLIETFLKVLAAAFAAKDSFIYIDTREQSGNEWSTFYITFPLHPVVVQRALVNNKNAYKNEFYGLLNVNKFTGGRSILTTYKEKADYLLYHQIHKV